MCMDDKCRLLNELLEPFGYSYVLSQNIITTRIDAWQRDFGYGTLYDKAASRFGMVFDCLPVYFDYRGKTWLLELWKGQYGINTGCEIGLYHANCILEEVEREQTIFHSVEDGDMPQISYSLFRCNEEKSHLCQRHWWLTGFHVGCFSMPSDLCLRASITFPTCEMANAFTSGLLNAGQPSKDICRNCNTVTLMFATSTPGNSGLHKLRLRIVQWLNRFWCKVYLTITKPFCLSVDRLLYLYYYLPFAFRRTLRITKTRKHRKR